jgi:hypothetical protein
MKKYNEPQLTTGFGLWNKNRNNKHKTDSEKQGMRKKLKEMQQGRKKQVRCRKR